VAPGSEVTLAKSYAAALGDLRFGHNLPFIALCV
jgi:hypothetical protein